MLRDEDRMVALRGLPPVVRSIRRRQPLLDKTGGVFQDRLHAFAEQVIEFSASEPETPAEWRFIQRLKKLVEVSHPGIIPTAPVTVLNALQLKGLSVQLVHLRFGFLVASLDLMSMFEEGFDAADDFLMLHCHFALIASPRMRPTQLLGVSILSIVASVGAMSAGLASE